MQIYLDKVKKLCSNRKLCNGKPRKIRDYCTNFFLPFCTDTKCKIFWGFNIRVESITLRRHNNVTYRIDANTTALLIRAAFDNFLRKSPLFGANT